MLEDVCVVSDLLLTDGSVATFDRTLVPRSSHRWLQRVKLWEDVHHDHRASDSIYSLLLNAEAMSYASLSIKCDTIIV